MGDTPAARLLKAKPRQPGRPIGVRAPAELVARLDKAARETGHSRSETLLILLEWALDAYEKGPGKARKSG